MLEEGLHAVKQGFNRKIDSLRERKRKLNAYIVSSVSRIEAIQELLASGENVDPTKILQILSLLLTHQNRRESVQRIAGLCLPTTLLLNLKTSLA